MSTAYEKVNLELLKKYNIVWKIIFKEHSDINPVDLIFEENEELQSGYSISEDKIYIRLPKANIENFFIDKYDQIEDIPLELGWPIWLKELAHESIHCYQYKVNSEFVNTEGEKLAEFAGRFPGNGHGDDFYTSVFIASNNFGIDPEVFVRKCI